MGIFSKLAFWKKDDDLDFDKLADKELNRGMGEEGMPIQDDLGLDEQSPFGDKATEFGKGTDPFSTPKTPGPFSQQAPSSQTSSDRELELISSKLDTIKALLASLDQRVANIEKASIEKKKEPKLW
ncbi:MAG: hypothetical protein KKH52_04185 [Nanoarchaeota archaeon]|nr:hypothetical protein [Nanoarchaeota archaeon]MBU1623182.1 hypothetical protein [Nanoarchaeota archaeon]MBU1974569.1 hypothetical protein [Nanoarchaeota archaeon]